MGGPGGYRTVWTVPGTVGSTPEKDPRKAFVWWESGRLEPQAGMECLSEGIQTYTPLKFRDPGPTQKLRFRGWKIILGCLGKLVNGLPRSKLLFNTLSDEAVVTITGG